ncbi:MAG: 4-alpha-glucanotransferase [Pyrinomonadaceae bacterium]
MKFPRASGILLHPTSLPGDYGIGDLGPGAYAFIDVLAAAGQSYWQVLPLGPTGYGDSPYQSFSAFAGNPLLISPAALMEDGLLTKEMLDHKPEFPGHKVDFGAVYDWKGQLLPMAYKSFRDTASDELRGKFESFVQENDWWLDDYAFYRSVKDSQDRKPWYDWPTTLKLRNKNEITELHENLTDQIRTKKFYQFLFFKQWSAVKEYAGKNGIKIIGDLPIFVSIDSADVWCNQDKFKLNADGSAKFVAGVPPDYFSRTGQLWGNPIYDWDAMQKDGFRWWVRRVALALQMVDVVRIDHFRGFAATWEVPGGDQTAENGSWVDVPGKELFTALEENLGALPMIAEDLGVITPDVDALRDAFGFPGMRILQYAFGGDAKNRDLPHNYINNCVAYTGTHDNDTTVGWWHSQSGAGSTRDDAAITHEHDYCLKYLRSDGSEINWDLIRAVWASVADTAITPLQDVFGVGNEARMNLPASTSGNWSWRYAEGAITPEMIARLKELTEIYGRTK